MKVKEEILNDPDLLKRLATDLRAEADRAEARAEKLKVSKQPQEMIPGCSFACNMCCFIQIA